MLSSVCVHLTPHLTLRARAAEGGEYRRVGRHHSTARVDLLDTPVRHTCRHISLYGGVLYHGYYIFAFLPHDLGPPHAMTSLTVDDILGASDDSDDDSGSTGDLGNIRLEDILAGDDDDDDVDDGPYGGNPVTMLPMPTLAAAGVTSEGTTSSFAAYTHSAGASVDDILAGSDSDIDDGGHGGGDSGGDNGGCNDATANATPADQVAANPFSNSENVKRGVAISTTPARSNRLMPRCHPRTRKGPQPHRHPHTPQRATHLPRPRARATLLATLCPVLMPCPGNLCLQRAVLPPPPPPRMPPPTSAALAWNNTRPSSKKFSTVEMTMTTMTILMTVFTAVMILAHRESTLIVC